LRTAILGGLIAIGVGLAQPASSASAQYGPGFPPGYGYPMGYGPAMPANGAAMAGYASAAPAAMPATATVDPAALCRQSIAQAAYPVANQMLWFTQAANLYPMGPAGRPVLGPPVGYPGFGAIYGGYGPGMQFANAIGGQSLLNLAASPIPVIPTIGATLNGTGAELIGNIFTGIDTRQTIIGNRLTAAELNAGFTAFPREQAALLKEVLEGLNFYRELACPPNGGSGSNGGSGGNGNASMSENGNGNGQRP
jgi:hypothetical protein